MSLHSSLDDSNSSQTSTSTTTVANSSDGSGELLTGVIIRNRPRFSNIACRNLPECKYGSNCLYYHPDDKYFDEIDQAQSVKQHKVSENQTKSNGAPNSVSIANNKMRNVRKSDRVRQEKNLRMPNKVANAKHPVTIKKNTDSCALPSDRCYTHASQMNDPVPRLPQGWTYWDQTLIQRAPVNLGIYLAYVTAEGRAVFPPSDWMMPNYDDENHPCFHGWNGPGPVYDGYGGYGGYGPNGYIYQNCQHATASAQKGYESGFGGV
jgi:hypothetical protein